MPRLLNSVYSNPVGEAIDAFAKITNVLDTHEAAGQRRELVAAQIARDRLAEEKTKKDMAFEEKQRGWLEKIHSDTEFAGTLVGAYTKSIQNEKDGKPLDEGFTKEESKAWIRANSEATLGSGSIEHVDADRADINKIAEATAALEKSGVFETGGVLSLEKIGLQEPWTNIQARALQAGDSLYGEVTKGRTYFRDQQEGKGIYKVAEDLIIDPKTGTVVTNLKIIAKTGGEPVVAKHIQADGKTSIFMAPSNPTPSGLSPGGGGNIDLSKRPVVLNPDGSKSTVLSASFRGDDGKEVLVPLIGDDGKTRTIEEARKDYYDEKSPYFGKHLGIFENPQDATAYAVSLHNDPMWKADLEAHQFNKDKDEWNYKAPLTHGRGPGAGEAVVRQPAGLLRAQIQSTDRMLSTVQSIMARLNPQQRIAEIAAQKKSRDFTAAMNEIGRQNLDPSKSGDRSKILSLLPDTMSIEEKTKTLESLTKNVGRKRSASKTIYGPGGATKEIPIEEGKEYTPPKGWSLSKPGKDTEDKPLSDAAIGRRSKEVNRLAFDEYLKHLPKGSEDDPDISSVKKSKDPDKLREYLSEDKQKELDAVLEFTEKLIERDKMLPREAYRKAKKEIADYLKQGK